MSEPEQAPPLRRVPPLAWIGIVFVVLAVAVDDVRAFYVGGALLFLASLQWARRSS